MSPQTKCRFRTPLPDKGILLSSTNLASSNCFSLAFLLAFLPWVLASLALASDSISSSVDKIIRKHQDSSHRDTITPPHRFNPIRTDREPFGIPAVVYNACLNAQNGMFRISYSKTLFHLSTLPCFMIWFHYILLTRTHFEIYTILIQCDMLLLPHAKD